MITQDNSQELRQLLQSTVRVGLRFCPLEYIRVMSRQLDKEISGCHLKKATMQYTGKLYGY